MSVTATTTKTSVSIQNEYWEKIKASKNRSLIINNALEVYFDREKYLEKAKHDYWKNVYFHIENKTGEYVELNLENEKITDELLEEKLWN